MPGSVYRCRMGARHPARQAGQQKAWMISALARPNARDGAREGACEGTRDGAAGNKAISASPMEANRPISAPVTLHQASTLDPQRARPQRAQWSPGR